jgi:ATP-binding cassette, subfamily C, bacterial LapB
LRWRGWADWALSSVSFVEAKATALAALLVDAFTRSALRARLDAAAGAFRLELPPAPAEWGASILLGFFALATPFAAWLTFDRIVYFADAAEGAWTLALIMLGAGAFVVAEGGLRYVRTHLADRASVHRESLRSARALARLAAAPLDGRHEDGAPARAARLESAAALIDLQTGGLRRAVLELPFAFVAFVAMAFIGGWLALAPLALVVGVLVVFAASAEAAACTARERDGHDARSDDFVAECVAHLPLLRGAAMEPFMARRMEQLLSSGRDLEWRRIRAADRAEDLTSLLEAATLLTVAALGGVVALQGDIGLGALAASMLLAMQIVRPTVRIAAAAQRAAALGPDGVLPELAQTPVALQADTRPADLHVDAVVAGARLMCSARPGETIALTGTDGSALSRVLRTLAGLEAPDEGAVLLSGEFVTDYRAAYPGAVALVTPRAVLFSGTVMENLTLFGRGASEQAALAACDVLGLRPEIDRLPRKLDTQVGEGVADGVSASLAHRLSLARAIAMGPRLLLLEEPQARLDAAADRAMTAGLASLRGRMTVVMSTSRPSYVALADRAFVLEGDRFIASAPSAQRRTDAA